MTEKRVRLYLILLIVAGGAVFFLYEVLSGEAPADAALSTVIFIVVVSLMSLFLLRRRRKTLRRLGDQGQLECYIRRSGAPEGDRYRKWNFGLVKPAPGVLTFQPVLGKTSIARGEPFELRVHANSGSRYPATKWDKFNRLEPNAIVLPLRADDGPVEVAGQTATLDRIEASLGTEPREAHS